MRSPPAKPLRSTTSTFRLLSPEVWVSLFVVWRKQRVFSPVVRETLERLKEKFA